MMKEVTIVCDGSSLGNGSGDASRAAAAAILSCLSVMRAVGVYLGAATNQQAEIIAACIALEHLREPCQVTLYTDSQYVVETMNGAFARKSNHDLWSRLDAASAAHTMIWKWVKGHSSRRSSKPIDASVPRLVYRQQEACDKLARAIAGLGEVHDQLLTEAVNKVRGVTSPAVAQAVMNGLRYLCNDCDGARSQDDVGFNKYDVETGHRLASRETLSEREVDLGRVILRKYHRQLVAYDPTIVALI